MKHTNEEDKQNLMRVGGVAFIKLHVRIMQMGEKLQSK